MANTTTTTAALLKRLPELEQGKMPAVDPRLTAALAGEILDGGEEAVTDLIDSLEEVDNGSDWKSRFLLHAVTNAAAAPGAAAQRGLVAGVLIAESIGERAAGVRVFLLSQLRLIADANSVPKLTPLLAGNEPGLADAAAVVLVSVGSPALPPLRDALNGVTGRRRDVIANAILQIGGSRR